MKKTPVIAGVTIAVLTGTVIWGTQPAEPVKGYIAEVENYPENVQLSLEMGDAIEHELRSTCSNVQRRYVDPDSPSGLVTEVTSIGPNIEGSPYESNFGYLLSKVTNQYELATLYSKDFSVPVDCNINDFLIKNFGEGKKYDFDYFKFAPRNPSSASEPQLEKVNIGYSNIEDYPEDVTFSTYAVEGYSNYKTTANLEEHGYGMSLLIHRVEDLKDTTSHTFSYTIYTSHQVVPYKKTINNGTN